MGCVQDEQNRFMVLPADPEAKDRSQPEEASVMNISKQAAVPQQKGYIWWLRVAIYVLLLLGGQTAGTLLGRLYFEKGGNSKWMATLVQPAGFPVILPYYFLSPSKNSSRDNIGSNRPSLLVLTSLYVGFGICGAGIYMLYSLGLLYLPVSTFSLVCASQLAFNALFSFFLNSQKFTPYIFNSLVLVTISSVLLVFQGDDSTESTNVPKGKYAIGFLCTLAASAGYGLMLSSTQLAFKKILKQETLRAVMDMIFYPSIVATLVILVGLFASGEWRNLKAEMEGFELGKVSYFMTLIWTAISWQVFSIGCVGLMLDISSLFSNVISTFGLPIVPVLAVICFHDKMNGIKVISIVLAIWGFVSYAYQEYLDYYKSKTETSIPPEWMLSVTT